MVNGKFFKKLYEIHKFHREKLNTSQEGKGVNVEYITKWKTGDKTFYEIIENLAKLKNITNEDMYYKLVDKIIPTIKDDNVKNLETIQKELEEEIEKPCAIQKGLPDTQETAEATGSPAPEDTPPVAPPTDAAAPQGAKSADDKAAADAKAADTKIARTKSEADLLPPDINATIPK